MLSNFHRKREFDVILLYCRVIYCCVAAVDTYELGEIGSGNFIHTVIDKGANNSHARIVFVGKSRRVRCVSLDIYIWKIFDVFLDIYFLFSFCA